MMIDERSDPELIRAVRGDDAAAWAELWSRHRVAAVRAAEALCPSHAEAEDVVADTFDALRRALATGHGPEIHFRAYLLTAVRHRAGRARRTGHERELRAADDLPEVAWLDAVPEDGPNERSIAVEAFASLSERYRTVLWHAEVEREPLATVAAAVGVSTGAVAQLVVRARRQLRRAYVQKHLDHARPRDGAPACETVHGLLGGYFVESLSARDRAKVEAHLDACDDCDRLVALAGEVGAGLRACLLPGVLGSAGAARYLAGTGHLAWIAKGIGAVRSHPAARPAPAAAAVMVAVLLAASGVGLHATLARSSAHIHRPGPAPSASSPSASVPSAALVNPVSTHAVPTVTGGSVPASPVSPGTSRASSPTTTPRPSVSSPPRTTIPAHSPAATDGPTTVPAPRTPTTTAAPSTTTPPTTGPTTTEPCGAPGDTVDVCVSIGG